MDKYLIWTLIAIFSNIMDSITTDIGLHKFPEHLKPKEANPIADKAFQIGGSSFIIFNIFKHLVILAVIWVAWFTKAIESIQFLAIMLVLVVINNVYVLATGYFTKKRHNSVLRNLAIVLHIPSKLEYAFFILVIFGLAWCICNFGFGVNVFLGK